MSSPPRPFFFSFFLPVSPFLLFDRAAGFLPPRPGIVARPTRAGSVKAGPPGGATRRGLAFTELSTTAGLMGRVDYPCLLFIRLRVSTRYPDHGCFFWQVLLRSPWRVR